VAHLEERKAKLEHYWAEYNEVQSRLESLDESEDCYRDGSEEAFYALSAKIRELIFPSSTLRMSIFSLSSSSVRDSDRSTHIRLPKLNLPTFSGKYEWFPFFDTFNSVIHSSLSNTQRFHYERSPERYDNKRVIVQTHVKVIMDLPTITKENAISEEFLTVPRNICTPFRHRSVPRRIGTIFSSSF